MIQTKIPQTFFKNSESFEAILFAEVTQVNFLTLDKTIVIYSSLGYFNKVLIPSTEEIFMEKCLLENKVMKFTETEMRELLLNIGKVFNNESSNLLATEINSLSDDLLFNNISENSNKYFNIDIDKWTKS